MKQPVSEFKLTNKARTVHRATWVWPDQSIKAIKVCHVYSHSYVVTTLTVLRLMVSELPTVSPLACSAYTLFVCA